MIDTILMNTLKTIVPACAPEPYEGNATEYLTWTYDELPALIADGKPDVIRYIVSIAYVLPRGKNGALTRTAIRNALISAGFAVPKCFNAGDNTAQRWVIETEYKETAHGTV